MSLLIAIETFLIFSVFFIERFIASSAYVAPAYVAPASSASVASTALHGRYSFGLRRSLHNCLDVFSRRYRVCWYFFGYQLSLVVKSF